jgi:metal-responsive CopG/Arc/MetJ family transcriptional regulator
MVKVTFSLDEETVEQIRRAATRLGKPQSQIVRDAVADYAARVDRLSERERLTLLGVLEDLRTAAPTRSARAVDEELGALRTARRHGGRRSA